MAKIFFSTASNENKEHSMWAESGVEKKICINWLMNIELNFSPHYGTNYVFVVDNSLKKTNKHQLHLLKVKSTEIVKLSVG